MNITLYCEMQLSNKCKCISTLILQFTCKVSTHLGVIPRDFIFLRKL